MSVVLQALIMLLMAHELVADISIQKLTYDEISDQVIIKAQFPGRCVAHDLKLVPIKQDDARYHYQLVVSNSEVDPCNGMNDKTTAFSMENVTIRPAELLISPHADGSSPHVIELPKHRAAQIVSIKNLIDKRSLTLKVKASGEIFHNRFYLEVDERCSGTYAPTCTAVVRDKMASRFSQKKITTGSTTVSIENLRRPLTLVFRGEAGQNIRVHLP